MADMNNFGDIKENFEHINDILDSMRAQNAMNAGSADKVLANINKTLESLNNDENSDLIKVFLAELKRSLDERHNFVSSKFSELENSFKSIVEKTENQLQGNEIKEVFDIIATNLNGFSKDFASQEKLIAEINLKIEELKEDDSQKRDILRNIAVLKVELEKFSNGFESIILNLNNNFRETAEVLVKLDSSESLNGIKKDIENVFLSSNAILSTLQVIDRKNRELEDVLTHVVTTEDFKIEREQIAKLIAQNIQITDYISTLPKQTQVESLTEKIDATVAVVNALKNMLNDTGKQNQKLLTAQLDNLESKILNISTEDEFIGFRKELAAFSQDIMQSTSEMKDGLSETNSGLKDLCSFLSEMDIKASFEMFAGLSKVSENNVKKSMSDLGTNLTKEIEKNKNITKSDIEENTVIVNEKIELTKKELEEGSKSNLSTILEHLQSVVNNLFSVKNALHVENLESAEAVDAKLDDIKETFVNSNNFILQNSDENLGKIVSSVETVFQEITTVKENLSESSSAHSKNIGSGFSQLSQKIGELKEELNQNSQESFANLLSIVDDFSQEISTIKAGVELSSQENTQEIKGFIETVSEKLVSLKDALKEDSENNSSEIKRSIDSIVQAIKFLKNGLEQTSATGFTEIGSNIAGLSQKLEVVQEDLKTKSESNLALLISMFDDFSKEFNTHKALLSESAQINFETVSLYIQNLNKRIEETKAEFDENIKENISELRSSISALPETIKENQTVFENEKRVLIEENSKSVAELGEKIQSLVKGILSKDNPFKENVLGEFEELKSSLSSVKNAVASSNHSFGENIEMIVNESLVGVENSISQYSESYNNSLLVLQNRISSYFENIQSSSQESDLKLENSLREAGEIKTEVKSIIELLSELKEDSTLCDFSTEISKNFEGILLNITQLEEISSAKNTDSLKSVLSTLEEKFESVSTDLKNYKNFSTTEINEVLSELEEKTATLKTEIGLTGTDVLSSLSSKTEEIISSLYPISDSVEKLCSFNFEEFTNDIKTQVDDSYSSITSSIKQSVKGENSQQLNEIAKEFELLDEKIETISAQIFSGKTEEFEELKSALDLITQNLENISANVNNKIEDEFFVENFTSLKQSASDIKTQTAEIIDDALKTLLGKLEDSTCSIKEAASADYSTFSEVIESSLSSSNEKVFEKIENLEESFTDSQYNNKAELIDEIIQSQDIVKTAIIEEINKTQSATEATILEELGENITFIKEIIGSLSEDKSTEEDFAQKLEALQVVIETALSGLENKVSTSHDTYKTSTQSLLSEVKTSFYEKVDDSLDELRSFIEILEDKKNVSEVIDELKSDIFDKFGEFSDSLSASIDAISVKEELDEVNKNLEESINNLFTTIEEKFNSSINENETISGLSEKSEEINRRIEELKKVVTDEITEKLDTFELNIDKKNQDFSTSLEDMKNSMAELKESFIDLSLNSNMEMSTALIAVQEKMDNIDEKLGEINFKDELCEAIEASKTQINESVSSEFELINQKLDVLTSCSSDELEDNVREIKEVITSQGGFIEKIEKLEELSKLDSLDKLSELDGLSAVKDEILSVLKEFKEKLDIVPETQNEGSSEGIKEALSGLKEDLFENLIEIFNQISFVEETEDLKDFIEEKTDEIKEVITAQLKDASLYSESSDSSAKYGNIGDIRAFVDITKKELRESLKSTLGTNFKDILSSLDILHEKTGSVDFNCFNLVNEIKEIKSRLLSGQVSSGGAISTDYSYSLQDVESDIAKVRLALKEISQTKGSIGSGSFSGVDKLSDDITSLSTRTNKILLNSDESYSTLRDNLSEFKNIIYQLEEKIRYIDNTETINSVDKKLDGVNKLMLSSVNSDKIFNQTFMYLAEWIDKADERLANIEENLSEVNDIKKSINGIEKSMIKSSDLDSLFEKFSKKFDKQQEKINSLEATIEKLSKKTPLKAGKDTDLKTLVKEVLALADRPESKSDAKLAKKVDNIDKQLATFGKSIEKISSYVD